MNYLELVNDFLVETDYSDQVASLTNLQEDELRASIWVRDAWLQIQRQERWSFMSREGSLITIPTQETYLLSDIGYSGGSLDTVGFLDTDSFRNESTETRMIRVSFEALRWQKAVGSPKRVAVDPNCSSEIRLSPIPDTLQLITMNTWYTPIILLQDTDVPLLPVQYHKAIVWLAISNYAREQGGEWRGLRMAAHQEYNQMYHNLSNYYLPTMGPKVGILG
tara:strand:- start:558 stop:1220 length:663 start_codon:yes stop_codon:yes gene_type:complete